MAQVLKGLEEFCGVYIDDILIGSETWEDHVRHVGIVLSRLRDAGLTVKLTKCEFACSEVEYVGHRVGHGIMSPKEVKVKALLDAPRPQSKRDLQRLLGLANYYSRYIAHFSEMVMPLTNLLGKNTKFVWSEDAESSFNNIKHCMSSSPVLMIADYNQPFYLYVDASNFCIGACLMQEDKNGVHKPVCYYSKKLAGAQKNYSTSDKEGLALISAIRVFKTYLANKVIVYTDHEPLRYINTMAPTNQRLLRWCLELQPYDIEIRHIAGKNNVIADYLSRPCMCVYKCDVKCCPQTRKRVEPNARSNSDDDAMSDDARNNGFGILDFLFATDG
jgi:hypothetical protein